MKNTKKIVLIGLIILLGHIFNITTTATGIKRIKELSIIADKDAFVSLDDPNTNYGYEKYIIFGNFFGWKEAYLHFSFSNKPATWIKAEISIDMSFVSSPFNVTISLINDTWDDNFITWVNKPVHGEIIINIMVTEAKIYKIDISDYIEGRTGISICLNASDVFQNGWVQGFSREGYLPFAPEGAPQLIWTYQEIIEINITSPSSSDVVVIDERYTIEWSSIGQIDKVGISLYKGNEFIDNITTSSFNVGLYTWRIQSSDGYEVGNDYKIYIWDINDLDVYDFSDEFTIVNPPPSIGAIFLFSVVIIGLAFIGILAIIYKIKK